jgi:ferric iron reductase protein FhuF
LIPLLAPIFQGDWRRYGSRVSCDPALYAVATPLDALLRDDARLDALLDQAARRRGGADPRAVASAWTLDYFAALLPSAVVAASVLQHRLPLAPHQVRLLHDADGRLRHICLAGAGADAAGTGTEARYEELVWQHLDPLVGGVARRARLAPRVLWSNALRRMDAIFKRAGALPHHSGILVADRALLIARPAWSDGRDNPLHYAPAKAAAAAGAHRNCCLYHRLPGQTFCAACPLSPAERDAADRGKPGFQAIIHQN